MRTSKMRRPFVIQFFSNLSFCLKLDVLVSFVSVVPAHSTFRFTELLIRAIMVGMEWKGLVYDSLILIV